MSRETPEVLTGFKAGGQRHIVDSVLNKSLHISTACIILSLWCVRVVARRWRIAIVIEAHHQRRDTPRTSSTATFTVVTHALFFFENKRDLMASIGVKTHEPLFLHNSGSKTKVGPPNGASVSTIYK